MIFWFKASKELNVIKVIGFRSERRNESDKMLSLIFIRQYPLYSSGIAVFCALVLLFRRSRFGARDQPDVISTNSLVFKKGLWLKMDPLVETEAAVSQMEARFIWTDQSLPLNSKLEKSWMLLESGTWWESQFQFQWCLLYFEFDVFLLGPQHV